MGFFSKIFGTKQPVVGADGKVGCRSCGARILLTTAEKHQGLCCPCFNRPAPISPKMRNTMEQLYQAGRINTSRRVCHECGKPMERGLKLVTNRSMDILVRNLCSEACSDAVGAHYNKKHRCIWCEGDIGDKTITRGWLKEPYCSEECFKAAGKAMAGYEFTKGHWT